MGKYRCLTFLNDILHRAGSIDFAGAIVFSSPESSGLPLHETTGYFKQRVLFRKTVQSGIRVKFSKSQRAENDGSAESIFSYGEAYPFSPSSVSDKDIPLNLRIVIAQEEVR